MAEYDHNSIAVFVERVARGEIILPAMQRDFVWKKEKIYSLFESLMREYPIGTFICWRIEKKELEQYAFNSILKDYDERTSDTRKDLVKPSTYKRDSYLAVLDGQQRITSLVMGVIGSYTEKTKQKNADGTFVYQRNVLCLNILYEQKDFTQPAYQFQFVPEDQCEILDESCSSYWVPVRLICDKDLFIYKIVNKAKAQLPSGLDILPGDPHGQIERLRKALVSDSNITYYTARDKDLAEVVEIFIRVNSQGKPLDASDLILSSATVHIFKEDIHEFIRKSVDALNACTTSKWITKEFILQTGLLCIDSESLSFGAPEVFKNSETLKKIFKDKWDSIIKAIKLAITMAEAVGFEGVDIPKSVLNVLSYYFYKNPKFRTSYPSSKGAAKDRVLIRQWILRSMINSVFVDGTGTSLKRIRALMCEHCQKGFPLQRLLDNEENKRSLIIDESRLDIVLKSAYGNKHTLPLLGEICGYVDLVDKEVDHIYAKSNINSKSSFKKFYKVEGDIEEVQKQYKSLLNVLPNLQILDKSANGSKGNTLYHDWVRSISKEQQEKHLLPIDKEYEFTDFVEFYEVRAKMLKKAILRAFPNSVEEILRSHGLKF